jgi:hypothetical protein
LPRLIRVYLVDLNKEGGIKRQAIMH